MSEFIGVVTAIGEQKLAASIGGAALALTTIRVGDGAGAAITPNAAMTDLVRRVGAAYPIVSSGRDATNPACWRVAATIPIEDGPFDIREIGVFDGDGDMIAIAKHVLVEKRAPAQGAAIELTSEMVFPVSGSAQIDIHVCAAAGVSIQRELRAPFLVVDASAVAAPPANPALGATYLAPAGATGAWAGLDGRLAQWDGVAWVAADAARGHVVADAARAKGDPARFLRREAEGWEAWAASLDDYGLARLASRADLIAALGGPVVDAALLAGMLGVDANGDAAYMATCSIFETPGTYSWVAPAWARRALIHGVGAAAGGGGWNAPYPGGGGSGGNKATAMVRVTPGVSYPVVIGAGGVGGTYGGAAATGGGVTRFGDIMTLAGGLPGSPGTSAPGLPGNAPSLSLDTFDMTKILWLTRIQGGEGGLGQTSSVGGMGGSSGWPGTGGQMRTGSGRVGSGFGAGGSGGGLVGSGSPPGGNGLGGAIHIFPC